MVSPVAPPPPLGPPPGSPAGSGDELPIDVEMIKVLASDTRRDILRLLGERRKTLTELSEALGLKKATILEHLKKLQEANLIKRLDEDDRLWIYYELSPRGKRLVHPGRTRFYLIMAGSVVALVAVAAIVVAATMLGAPGLSPSQEDAQAVDGSSGAPLMDGRSAGAVPDVVWRGFDDDVDVALETTPPGARLLIGDARAPAATVPASAGKAVLDAQTIDALPTGRHALALSTSEGVILLDLALDVRDPPLALVPAVVPAGEDVRIQLWAGEPGLRAPSVSQVEVDGAQVVVEGDRAFAAPRLDPGTVDVRVGRLATLPLRVVANVPLTWSLAAPNVTLTTLAGSEVLLDAAAQGVADANGTLTIPWPAPGEHVLSVVAPDGGVREEGIIATAESIAPLAPRLALNAVHGGGPQVLSAHVDVQNSGPTNETVTLLARKDGAVIASTVVDAPARGTVDAALRAEVRTDAPVTIEAYATRFGTFSELRLRAAEPDAAAGSAPPPAAAPEPSAPASGTPPTPGMDDRDDLAYRAPIGERAPDAQATLAPLVAPTVAGAGSMTPSADEAPAVPGPGAALVLVAAAVAALALTRRAARRP